MRDETRAHYNSLIVTVHGTDGVAEKVRELAKQERRSVSQMAKVLLEDALAAREAQASDA
jgi:hypothetical protein